jgi:beta-N-acetylhexosaminidase
VRAVAAGVDALLVCHTAEAQHEVIAHLAAAVVDGLIPESRIEEARTRLATLAARHARSV